MDFKIKKVISKISTVFKQHKSKKLIMKSCLFDEKWYLMNNPDVVLAGKDALEHYLEFGFLEGRKPTALFDTDFYMSQNNSINFECVNPLYHYLTEGHSLGLNPNRFFDENYVKKQTFGLYPESVSGLECYISQNDSWIINPSKLFDNNEYFEVRSDVKAAKLSPLKHYLSSGYLEFDFMVTIQSVNKLECIKESPKLSVDTSQKIHIIKNGNLEDKNVVLYVCYAPFGRLSKQQERTIRLYKQMDIEVVLIVCIDQFESYPTDSIYDYCHSVIYRNNMGFDFGAWKDVIESVPNLRKSKSIILTNDSYLIIDHKKFYNFIGKVYESDSEVVFATENLEITSHGQSYFFCLKSERSIHEVSQFICQTPYYQCKDDLIMAMELKISSRLKDLGIAFSSLFSPNDYELFDKNLTIHKFKELIADGFPFIKIQLLQSGILKDIVELKEYLNEELFQQLKEHLENRVKAKEEKKVIIDPNPVKDDFYYQNGALRATNPDVKDLCYIPLADIKKNSEIKVLAVIHCFYVDIAEKILTSLKGREDNFKVVLTTDTDLKKEKLKILANKLSMHVEIRVCLNKGRDVEPMLRVLLEFRDAYEYVLHLHTKKSPHNDAHSSWAEHLFQGLIGSEAIIDSNIYLLSQDNVGVVYQEHHESVIGLRNWGYNYNKLKSILTPEINISSRNLLEFPTGTMFYAKINIFDKLLKKYDDGLVFENENGQVDGTTAHAVERSILYYSAYHEMGSIQTSRNKGFKVKAGSKMLKKYLRRVISETMSNMVTKSPKSSVYQTEIGEIYPVQFNYIVTNKRYNLVIPTAKPEKIYGGITTAIKVFKEILPKDALVRVIITSDDINYDSVEYLNKTFNIDFLVNTKSNLEDIGSEIVDLNKFRDGLDVSANDVFFATAWWTANVAFRAYDFLNQFNIKPAKVIYLIQDYEPGFYQWSNHSALARSTYERPDETIAIINSEELGEHVLARHNFIDALVVPYRINANINLYLSNNDLESRSKKKIILVYGRPSVKRNLFEVIVEGLTMWQEKMPSNAKDYQIIFVGEEFDKTLISQLINAEVKGKLSLNEYAEYLIDSSIGISLMESPHPSYPPLEMAYSGALVITNTYEGKSLERRSDNIHSLRSIEPEQLANQLNKLISESDGLSRSYRNIADLEGIEITEFEDLAKAVRDLNC